MYRPRYATAPVSGRPKPLDRSPFPSVSVRRTRSSGDVGGRSPVRHCPSFTTCEGLGPSGTHPLVCQYRPAGTQHRRPSMHSRPSSECTPTPDESLGRSQQLMRSSLYDCLHHIFIETTSHIYVFEMLIMSSKKVPAKSMGHRLNMGKPP